MLELLNQLDGFTPDENIKVCGRWAQAPPQPCLALGHATYR